MWESMAAFGCDVVPEVNWMLMVSVAASGESRRRGPWRPRGRAQRRGQGRRRHRAAGSRRAYSARVAASTGNDTSGWEAVLSTTTTVSQGWHARATRRDQPPRRREVWHEGLEQRQVGAAAARLVGEVGDLAPMMRVRTPRVGERGGDLGCGEAPG